MAEAVSKFSTDEVARYSRQMILDEIAAGGQEKLRNASVLIIGAGGLGCPSGLYLAASGIGRIGIVDYDVVEISNLHRQILHTVESLGKEKTTSFAVGVGRLNPKIRVDEHRLLLHSSNALSIIEKYDIVLDASDNPSTRYLVNDVCVLAKRPLVSGSALRFEGQLTVYNYGDGPCYRCLYPIPPTLVTNCSEAGVVGAVTGVIGSLQALEAMKIILGIGDVLSGRLLVFDGLSATFRNVKLRSKQSDCNLCEGRVGLLSDYDAFVGGSATDKCPNLRLLTNGVTDRVSVFDLKELLKEDSGCIGATTFIDVRSDVEFAISHLRGFSNIPLSEIMMEQDDENLCKWRLQDSIICICRRGNDSQRAVLRLRQLLKNVTVRDVVGGLTQWAEKVDSSFSIY